MGIIKQKFSDFLQLNKNLPAEFKKATLEERAEIIGRGVGLAVALGLPAWAGWQFGKDISDYFYLGQPAKLLTDLGSSVGLAAIMASQYGNDAKDTMGDFSRLTAEKYRGLKDYLDYLRDDSTDRG